MKTNYLIISLIVILFFTLTANSQITKGNWMVGGDGSYLNNTISHNGYTSKYTIIEINPDIGYFIKDKFAIGSYLNFQHLQLDTDNSSYYLGIFTRYYFFNKENVYNAFSQINYDYNLHTSDLNSFGYKYGFKLGVIAFFTNSVGLELSLGYDTNTNTTKGEYTNKIKTDRIKANIGFHFYLEKK